MAARRRTGTPDPPALTPNPNARKVPLSVHIDVDLPSRGVLRDASGLPLLGRQPGVGPLVARARRSFEGPGRVGGREGLKAPFRPSRGEGGEPGKVAWRMG